MKDGDFVQSKEGGHWYTKEGKPAYTQIIQSGKNKGKERNTTLRDAKKLGLVPSVTTILGILDKGFLNQWKTRQAVKKAVAEVRGEVFNERDYAAEGSAIHYYVECWVKNNTYEHEVEPYIKNTFEFFKSIDCTKDDFISEASFATEKYGGAVDLHSPNKKFIVDLKTKDLDSVGSKKLNSDDYCMQLVAYRDGLNMPKDTRLINLFLSRTSPEIRESYEYSKEEIERAEKMFDLLVKLYYIKNNF